ncbi:MAG: hypothetical protein VX916_06900, partial [Planctomycetota bacterium]|nr:hypothetical protein [Planctomycetota bacterium]
MNSDAEQRKEATLRGIWALWLFLSLIAGAGRVLAQDQDVNGRIGEAITLEMVQAAEARLEEMTHLDDAALDQVKAIYGKIREQLRMADDWHSQVNEYELLLSQSQDDRLEEIQTAIADLASEKPWSISDEDSLSQLEQMLARAEAEMESARQAMAGVVGVQQRREDRRNLVPQALAEARDRFEGLSGGGGSGGDDAVELLTARDWLVLARRQSILEEIRTYELESQSDSVRGDLLANELQLSQHVVIQAEARTKLWRERVLERREMEARQAEEEARSAAERAIKGHVAVRDAAERNAVLAGLRVGPDGLVEQLKKASRLADQVRRELTELQDQKRRVEGRVAAAGTNYTIGQFLVDRRRELPDLRAHERSVTTRSDIIAEIRLSRIEQREETAQFVSLDDRVKDLLLPERVEDHADVGIALRSELETRVSLLQDLGRDLDAYLDLLYDLDASERALISQTEEFAAYIDERVLWVRIAPPVISDPIGLWKKGVDALSWLLDGSAWRDLAGDVGRRLLSHPLVYGLQVILLGLLVSVRPTLRVRLLETANLVTRVRTDRLVHTIKALFLTLALAVIIPVMIWCAAGLLSQASPASALAQAGAAGLRSVAGLLLVTGFLTRAFRENGLAEHHFRWKRESLSLVRGQLRLLLTILLPALFIVRALEWEGMPAHTESLGSLAFCVMQVSVCLFAVRVLHPQSGVFAPIVEEHPDGWVSRLRWLWYPVAIGLPILLLVLSLMGYLYTAHQFQIRLTSTLLLVGGVCLFHAVALRVLRATERRLALQQYIKRREVSQEVADQGHLFDDEGIGELAEEEIDVGLVTGQSRRLVQIAVAAALFLGAWMIWSDVLPAVRVAGDVPLWSHQVEAWEQVRMPDGTLRTQSYIELQPVTLLDLLVASALLVLAFVAARNLPGLLEMLILRHLPIQR